MSDPYGAPIDFVERGKAKEEKAVAGGDDSENVVSKGHVGLGVSGSQSKFGLADNAVFISIRGPRINLAERKCTLVYTPNGDKRPFRATLVDNNVMARVELGAFGGFETYDGNVRFAVLKKSPPKPVLFLASTFDDYLKRGDEVFYDKYVKNPDGSRKFQEYAREITAHVVFSKTIMALPPGRYYVAKLQESSKVGEATRARRPKYVIIKYGKHNLSDMDYLSLVKQVSEFPLDTSMAGLNQTMNVLQQFPTLGPKDANGALIPEADLHEGGGTFEDYYRERILGMDALEEFMNAN